jgi:N utilization substance protein B
MGARRSGREAALQMLFQAEAAGASADDTIQLYFKTFEADPEGREYACAVVRGVDGAKNEVDARIRAASANWRLERMSRVDRAILRMGTWELAYRGDVPRAVVIDEAVELAKAYGAEESSAFVNGVLDKIAEELGRKD